MVDFNKDLTKIENTMLSKGSSQTQQTKTESNESIFSQVKQMASDGVKNIAEGAKDLTGLYIESMKEDAKDIGKSIQEGKIVEAVGSRVYDSTKAVIYGAADLLTGINADKLSAAVDNTISGKGDIKEFTQSSNLLDSKSTLSEKVLNAAALMPLSPLKGVKLVKGGFETLKVTEEAAKTVKELKDAQKLKEAVDNFKTVKTIIKDGKGTLIRDAKGDLKGTQDWLGQRKNFGFGY